MKLDLVRDRLHLTFPYQQEMVALAKGVASANWSKTRGAWTYPANLTTFRLLRRRFGARLTLTRECRAWARAEITRERTLRGLGATHDADLVRMPIRYPSTSEAMATRPYQRSGARFIAESGVRALLADEPGLGKTLQVLAGLTEADRLDGSHLVFATKTAMASVWQRQINMWTPDAQTMVLPEGAARRTKAVSEFLLLDEPRFMIAGYASIRRLYGHWCKHCEIWEEDFTDRPEEAPEQHWLEDHGYKRAVRKDALPAMMDVDWDTVIADESHKVLTAYTPANVSQQTQALLDLKARGRIAITGTPLRGEEKRLWGTLDWLGYPTGGYWGWIDQFFQTENNGFGKIIVGIDPGKESLFHRSLDGLVLRRTRSEVRSDLPLGQRHRVLLPLEGKHAEQYEQFRVAGEARIAGGAVESMGLLSELTRLRQMAFGIWDHRDGKMRPTQHSPKIDWILEFLEARGVTGRKDAWLPERGVGFKYVIASQWTEAVDAIVAALDSQHISTFRIAGDTKQEDRDYQQRVFQSEDALTRVMVLNTMTGGESIELDAWCDEMVITDETYIADDQVQLEGRINNRSGRVSPRSWYYLTTQGTLEEAIAERNDDQHTLQHALLDGRRGVTTALHLIGRR